MAGSTQRSEGAASAYRVLFALGVLAFGISCLAGLYEAHRWGALAELFPDPNAIANKLYERGDLTAAEREYRMGDELGQSVLDNSARRVEIYKKTGDRERYVALYRTEVEERPLDPRPLFALGLVLSSVGEHEEARATLEKLWRLSPDFPGLLPKLAIAQLQTGDFATAEESFRLALERDPLSSELHEGLGRCLEERGELDEARREYERAVQLDPGRSSAQARLRSLDPGAVGSGAPRSAPRCPPDPRGGSGACSSTRPSTTW